MVKGELDLSTSFFKSANSSIPYRAAAANPERFFSLVTTTISSEFMLNRNRKKAHMGKYFVCQEKSVMLKLSEISTQKMKSMKKDSNTESDSDDIE